MTFSLLVIFTSIFNFIKYADDSTLFHNIPDSVYNLNWRRYILASLAKLQKKGYQDCQEYKTLYVNDHTESIFKLFNLLKLGDIYKNFFTILIEYCDETLPIYFQSFDVNHIMD